MEKSEYEDNIKFEGIPLSPGVALGEAYFINEEESRIRPSRIDKSQVSVELDKYKRALKHASDELDQLKSSAVLDEVKDILDAQIQILNDPELYALIRQKIEVHLYDAVYSVFSSFNEYIELLEEVMNERIRERTTDVVSLRDMVIKFLREGDTNIKIPEGCIVFSEIVSPTLMMQIHDAKAAGVVMHKGGKTSHSVILAQSLGLPCILGIEINKLKRTNVRFTVLDGESGELIINPDKATISKFCKKREAHRKREQKMLQFASLPSNTKDGTTFTLRSNIEFLEELPTVQKMNSEGIGLLRTETLFLQNEKFEIDEQVEFYNQILESTAPHSVTIRLLDIGGDKNPSISSNEANPFLGWRGIRMLLAEKTLLHNQLKSIFTVAEKYPGRVKLLVPMVSVISEIQQLKHEIERVKKECSEVGINTDSKIELGLMVEVPAIALLASRAARLVDFFSIGTNDLTQYTMAVDRGNEKISDLYQPWNPAVWKLILETKKGADSAGIPISVCGEMASDPVMAACLLGLGISELSMNPFSIPVVKEFLNRHTVCEMKEWVEKIIESESGKESYNLLEEVRNSISELE